MEVFRISSEKYASALTASGKVNRWNADNEYMLYAGSSRALATLESVVHMSAIIPSVNYKVMVIHIADHDNLISQKLIRDLPADWRIPGHPDLQAIGSDWYQNDKSLVLKVPSAVIIKEYNYIINTKHPAFKAKVKLIDTEDYFWDGRLFI